MKKLLTILSLIVALAVPGFAQVGARETLAPNVKFQGTNNTVPSGVTLKIDGTLNMASGTVTQGLINKTIGASTAAAGSVTGDATVLPAGTASVYPTTAADDTKGVRIHATDKVLGRTVMIGNGVSNKILKVYPPTGGTINGAAANAAFSSLSGRGVTVVCMNSTTNSWLAF